MLRGSNQSMMLYWKYRSTGTDNFAGAAVDKLGIPGQGLTLVIRLLINMPIWTYFYRTVKNLVRLIFFIYVHIY